MLDFACGWNHNIALMEDFDLLVWGANNYGQLGIRITNMGIRNKTQESRSDPLGIPDRHTENSVPKLREFWTETQGIPDRNSGNSGPKFREFRY
jgi:alpha-tubulin suppressor-like RCC1 family protein